MDKGAKSDMLLFCYIEGETRFMHKLSTLWFLVKNKKYRTAYVPWYFVFKMCVTVKWCIVSNDQTMGPCDSNKCSKWPPLILRQHCTAWHSLVHAQTCWHQSSSKLLKVLHKHAPSGVPKRKISIRVRSGEWGGDAISPWCPFNLLGYVTFY
jgi:hypothetical protein